jgi:hypothetical protein
MRTGKRRAMRSQSSATPCGMTGRQHSEPHPMGVNCGGSVKLKLKV